MSPHRILNRRLPTALAACCAAAVALAACDDVPSEAQVPAAATVAQDFSSGVTFSVTNDCTGETIDFDADVEGRLFVKTLPDGLKVRVSASVNARGEGDTSGERYHANGKVRHEEVFASIEPPVRMDLPFEARVTGKDVPIWKLRIGILITVPKGVGGLEDVRVDVREPTSKCD